jgi:copper chaperone/Cu+-exporting ATPase
MKLEVEGMHCGSCVRRLAAALSRVPGARVIAVEVGTADVDVDHDDVRRAVHDAIAKAGFSVAAVTIKGASQA